MPHRPSDADRRMQMRAWSAGMDIAAGMVAGGLIGWLIDRWLGHAPFWMLGLGLAGIAGGGYRFIKEAMAVNREAGARFASRPKAVRPGETGSGDAGAKPPSDASPRPGGPAILEPPGAGPGGGEGTQPPDSNRTSRPDEPTPSTSPNDGTAR